REVLANEFAQPYMQKLDAYVSAERAAHAVYPPADQVFAAFHATPWKDVRVLLLGQDPYHGEGEAHGLCFSVPHGVAVPPSLRNMLKELKDDIGCDAPGHGNLMHWAKQGMLLLNSVLTVRANEAASHKGQGWETFTDAVISRLSERPERMVFVLWGGFARKKKSLIDDTRHAVIESAHPSPLSQKGFFGTRPYSAINAALTAAGQKPIDWTLPA
ncbi:MAG: uracil-DNA glycosylase, partial [Planctomycetota bacterium]